MNAKETKILKYNIIEILSSQIYAYIEYIER